MRRITPPIGRRSSFGDIVVIRGRRAGRFVRWWGHAMDHSSLRARAASARGSRIRPTGGILVALLLALSGPASADDAAGEVAAKLRMLKLFPDAATETQV